MNGITLKRALQNGRHAGRHFPAKNDKRHRRNGDFPILSPKFQFAVGDTVFTIGSCFARKIEKELHGFYLPTLDFAVPKEEWGSRPNGLINEFNPGTISQRILAAVEQRGFGDLGVIEQARDEWFDLLLCGGGTHVSRARLLERRSEVDAVYRKLPGAHVVVITLGLVEAWYDREAMLYLNQWPHMKALRREPKRYELRVLDVSDSMALLQQSLSALIASGVKRILLTVSPVPLQSTFSNQDCVVANAFSKSVLRVCADQLSRRFPEVDYFPSYEIVMSGGRASFMPDNVHVDPDVVEDLVDYMTAAYVPQLQRPPRSRFKDFCDE